MTWCKDTARDEAVRAAEDNRTSPLPTLEEAIAAPFACAACGGFGMDHRCKESCDECDGSGRAMFPKSVSATSAPEHENKGVRMTKSDRQAADYRAEATAQPAPEATNGMRTERVTLEITRPVIANYPAPARHWMWQHVLRDVVRGDRESVRVVDEIHFDDLAQVAMERDAAIQRADRDSIKCSALADKVIGLQARVAELEARTSTPGEASCAAPAASNGNRPETPEGSAQAASGGAQQGVSSGKSGAQAGESGQGSRVKSGEPVAWMCEWTDHVGLHHTKTDAEDESNGDVVLQPLYRAPPQPRGWLTGRGANDADGRCRGAA
jgi:hypothetical protein